MQSPVDRARTVYRGFLSHPERWVVLGLSGIAALIVIDLVVLATRVAPGADAALLVVAGLLAAAAIVVAIACRRLLGNFRRPRLEQRLIADYAERYPVKNIARLARVLMLTGNTRGTEILVYAASAGRFDRAELTTLLELYRDPAQRRRAKARLAWLDPKKGALLARVLLRQSGDAASFLTAETLYAALVDLRGLDRLPRADQHHYVEALTATGNLRRAAEVVATWTAATPLERLLAAGVETPGSPAWARLVRAALGLAEGTGGTGGTADAAAPIAVPAASPLDALTSRDAPPAAAATAPARVSIIIPTAGDEAAVATTTASARASQLRGFEHLVVDGDAAAVNAALATAAGEFTAIVTAGDWLHPDLLERLVAALEDDPALPAASAAVAVIDPRGHFVDRVSEPVLLTRTALVRDRVGGIDIVGEAGAAEYRARIAAAFDTDIPVVPGGPLLITAGSAGPVHFGRRVYADCSHAWHAAIRRGEADPNLGTPGAPRPFHAPKRGSGDYDVILVSNWLDAGSKGGTQRSNEEELRALQRAGYRVAIAHLDALWLTTTPKRTLALSPRIVAALNEGSVELVFLDDEITAKLVIIRYPPVLEFNDRVRSGIRTSRVLVVANQGPYENDGSAHRYTVHSAEAQVRAMFGVDAEWAPQGPLIRQVLQHLVEPARLLDTDIPALIDVPGWSVERTPRAGRAPVIGRYSRDNVMKWPDNRRAIETVYRSSHYSTIVMGGDKAIARSFGSRPPASWTVWSEGEIPTREFLSKLDFFVYFHHSRYVEAFGRSIIEAMASRAVVILPRSFEPVFGDAALYAEPAGVEQLVLEVYADEARFEAQVARALDYIGSSTSYEFYQQLIAGLLEGTS